MFSVLRDFRVIANVVYNCFCVLVILMLTVVIADSLINKYVNYQNEKIEAAKVVELKRQEILYANDQNMAKVLNDAYYLEQEKIAIAEQKKAEEAANEKAKTIAVAQNAEYELMCKAVFAEAGGQPYSDQVRVAETIVKRTKSGTYPDTITGVIMQPGQFDVVKNGVVVDGYGREVEFDKLPEQTKEAAREALNGSNYLPEDSELQFRGSNGQMWFF